MNFAHTQEGIAMVKHQLKHIVQEKRCDMFMDKSDSFDEPTSTL